MDAVVNPLLIVEPGEHLLGSRLALGSVGFGCIATFITLFYAARGWNGAALALSVFGMMFVGVRFVFGRTINWLIKDGVTDIGMQAVYHSTAIWIRPATADEMAPAATEPELALVGD